MEKQPKIMEAEWLAELRKVSVYSDEGLSLKEWGEVLGLSPVAARRRLQKAQDGGLLVVGFRTDRALDGKEYRCPVYRVRSE